MKGLDYIAAFHGHEHEPDKFVVAVDSLLNATGATVRAIPFGCDQTSIGWLDGVECGDKRATLLYCKQNLSAFRLDYKFTEHGQKKTDSGRFFVLQQPDLPNVFVAFSVGSTPFFRRALLPLFEWLYPAVMLAFVANQKLKRLLDTFKAEGGYTNLIITRASQRLRYREGTQTRKIMPMVSWPDMTLSEAFQWIEEHNGWFHSLEFEVMSHERALAAIGVTRQGIVKADALFARAYEAFTIPVCKTIHANLKLFSQRARLERPDLSALPLVIDFERDQFRDVEENRRLIEAMQLLEGASVSVLHGNPYVHLSILDYHDGSAFDLWVLDRHRLILVPQLKASVPAIKRLINHIFDDYAEGRLLDYTNPQP